MSEVPKISILRKSQPVVLEIEEGKELQYFVKEMSGAQRDEYLNKTSGRTMRDAAGNVVGIKDYKGLYATLLSFCLYDAESKLIAESKIQEWPDTAQKALFEIARDLNGLGKPEGDEKND